MTRFACSRRTSILAVLAFVLLGALVSLAGCANAADSAQTGQAEGGTQVQQATDVTLKTLDGQTKKLSDLRGSPVIMSFWASWCPYCIEEMPDLRQIKEDYPNVEVLLVNCGEDAQTVQSYADDLGGNMTWVLDEDLAIQKAYPSNGIPYGILFNAEGEPVKSFLGSSPGGMYNAYAEAIKSMQ